MENTWILVIGNGDVQLKTKENWKHLLSQSAIKSPDFLNELDKTEGLYRVPPRVLGLLYRYQLKEYGKDLHFPLLDVFSKKFMESKESTIDRIIIILTDQENIFSSSERRAKSCRYWQDTITLQPIIYDYLKQKFPQASQDFLVLRPKSLEQNLDNWEEVLLLTQKTIFNLKTPKKAVVYVSHQGGTPAISSAMQFVAMARFGRNVKFLVAQELPGKTKNSFSLIPIVYAIDYWNWH